MKAKYTSPTLTIVTFQVENGFLGSSPDPVFNFDLFMSEDGDGDLNQAASYESNYWDW